MPTAHETLVAWYGPKHGAFGAFLAEVQRRCADGFGERFEPCALDCVHATLVDLSRNERGVNLAMARAEPASAPARTRELLARLAAELSEPIQVRFGGPYPADDPVESRGCARAERRFSVQGDKVVLIGWSDAEHERLGALRRLCEDYGVRHRYHRDGADDDCDCYLRVGQLRASPADAARDGELTRAIRASLDELTCELQLSTDALRVVRYVDESLPRESSEARPLAAYRPPGA